MVNHGVFHALISIKVFENLNNEIDAVYKFKRYEDASLEYTGIDKKMAYLGLFNTVVSRS